MTRNRKTIITLLTATVLLSGYCYLSRPEPCHPVHATYIIQPGDTLWGITDCYIERENGKVRPFQAFQQAIMDENPGLDVGNLQPGQKLNITYYVKGER